MRHARAAARLLGIAVVTTALYAVYLAGRLLARRSARWRNRMVRAWAHALSRLMNLHAEIDGPHPAGGFVLVANHVSYVDILLLSRCLDIVFVAKSEVRRWPALGALAASVDTIFIDRNSNRDALRVNSIVREALSRGAGIALFPEGTSSDGNDVLPFKPALLEDAARNAMPVHYAAIHYEPREVAWWGEMTFLPHLWTLLGLPRIDASLRFGGFVIAHERKILARALHRHVRHGLQRLRLRV